MSRGARAGSVRGGGGLLAVLVAVVLALGWAAVRVAGPGSGALSRDRGGSDRFGPNGGGSSGTSDITQILGGDDDIEGFARATSVVDFDFPADHGPHEAFRTEWWYLTANLTDEAGARFGTQWTLFRSTLTPPASRQGASGEAESSLQSSTGEGASTNRSTPERSGWETRQAYMAHFALTDVEEGRFSAFERFARGAQQLAGVEPEPFRAWLEDWELASAGPSLWPMRWVAEEDGVSIDLSLSPSGSPGNPGGPGKPLVLQGDRGLSQKSAGEGNASYYYSFTRLQAEGTVQTGGQTHTVSGTAWLDREWSTSVLAANQVGWDWFAIQLSDGRDLMLFQIRRDDGTIDAFSEGLIVDDVGRAVRLHRDDITVGVTDWWRSSDGSVEYPSGWRVGVPSQSLDLQIRPVLADQELKLTFRYWEGAVDVVGISDAEGVSGPEGPTGPEGLTGVGYVELTGYAARAPAPDSAPVPGSR